MEAARSGPRSASERIFLALIGPAWTRLGSIPEGANIAALKVARFLGRLHRGLATTGARTGSVSSPVAPAIPARRVFL